MRRGNGYGRVYWISDEKERVVANPCKPGMVPDTIRRELLQKPLLHMNLGSTFELGIWV